MQILETSGWEDYELIDSGNGKRLERFGKYTLVRPDPQAIWAPKLGTRDWALANATFDEKWNNKDIPESWIIKYESLKLKLKLTPFKHTGIFPEQSIHWQFIKNSLLTQSAKLSLSQISNRKFLNLFGYTGVASLVAAKAGAKVTHVDASKPAIDWLKENEKLNFDDSPIRVIVDDVSKFVEREIKRGNKYDAIIMDPPVYGHDPKGKVWDFNKDFPALMENTAKLLSDNPLFVIVNAYALSSSALMLENVMRDYLKKGQIEVGELGLKEKTDRRLLSTGIFSRWTNEN